MKTNLQSVLLAITTISLAAAVQTQAQTGPFPDNTWPPTINSNVVVDYGIFDPNANFTTTPSGWNFTINGFGAGGDENMVPVTFAGLTGDEAQDAFVNPADSNWAMYESLPVLDILLQVWGNAALYNADGTPQNLSILEGPAVTSPHGLDTIQLGAAPVGVDNSQWSWVLLEVTNAIDPDDGNRYVGDPLATTPFGGINGGTIRLQSSAGLVSLTVRAIAIGPQGAFGTTNQINVFAPPPVCPPQPPVNLTYVDVNQNTSNYLTIISNTSLGYTYNVQAGVGPSNDLRTAVQCTSGVMNFGILSNYLGEPCSPALPMKVCVEFYDDPGLAGSSFAPGTYATDAQGDTATWAPAGGFPNGYTLTGTGKWLKVALWVNGVDLAGVNTAPLTGGPTLIFNGNAPFVDRIELGVERSGTNALAGLDPDPSYLLNPAICDTNYGYYAEWAPYLDITNNVTVGSSGGDQLMVVSNAGPPGDQRLAEAPMPGSGFNNLQFALENNVFGPTYQDNADVIMIYTYYDDPALVGATLYPQVYTTLQYGSPQIIPPPAPYNTRATLQGTGKWVDAYFELPNVNFAGVNQGPQSVVRFETSPATVTSNTPASIFVSRVRYNVIRPCGSFEGINMLQTLGISQSNQAVSVNWFGTAALQKGSTVNGPFTTAVTVTNLQTNSYSPSPVKSAEFFKLLFPAYPPYLSPYIP